jgi:hypothetical protein
MRQSPVEGGFLKLVITVASKPGEEASTVRQPSEEQTRLRIRLEVRKSVMRQNTFRSALSETPASARNSDADQ